MLPWVSVKCRGVDLIEVEVNVNQLDLCRSMSDELWVVCCRRGKRRDQLRIDEMTISFVAGAKSGSVRPTPRAREPHFNRVDPFNAEHRARTARPQSEFDANGHGVRIDPLTCCLVWEELSSCKARQQALSQFQKELHQNKAVLSRI